MKKRIIVLLLVCFALFSLSAHAVAEKKDIKVLILPKMASEAEYYYNHYVKDGEIYQIGAPNEDNDQLYVKDGIALIVTGTGKVNAAVTAMSVLTDPRFNFSDALILSIGCAGSAPETTTMGDIFITTAIFDYDLGHHADPRDMETESDITWFHAPDYDDSSIIKLSTDLTDKVFNLVKDVKLETTPVTKHFLAISFDNAQWTQREPVVMKGTTSSGDNFFKGKYDLANCLYMTEHYNCPDPYVADDMEDIAIGVVLKRLGLLDHYVVIRTSVNMLVFMQHDTPESMWSTDIKFESEENIETADIYPTAMNNLFEVGRIIIDSYLDGSLVL